MVAMACVVLCLAMVSCNKETQNQYGEGSIYLPMSDLTIYPLGDVVNVSFTSPSDWTIRNDNGWISIDKTSGKAGNTDLTISVVPYYDKSLLAKKASEPREGIITFLCSNGDSQSFTVTQDRAYIGVIDEDSNKDIDSQMLFDWQGFEKNYRIESNVYWEIEVDQDDTHFDIQLNGGKVQDSAIYGNGEDLLSLKADSWFAAEEYNGKFVITSCKKVDNVAKYPIQGLNREISFLQNYLIFMVSEEEYDADLTTVPEISGIAEFAGSSKEFYVYCEDGVQPTWDDNNVDVKIVYSKKGGTYTNKDERSIVQYKYVATFVKANNDFDNEKSILRTVTPSGSNEKEAKREITFVQDKYLFEVKEDGEDVDNIEFENEGGEKEFTLTTDGKWSILSQGNSGAPWGVVEVFDADGNKLTANNNLFSGRGNAIINIKTNGRNLSFTNDNNATFTFTATEIDKQKSINVVQPKFNFGMTIADKADSLNVSSHSSKDYAVNITSSGEWLLELSNNSSWVNTDNIINSANGDYSGKLSFDVNEGDVSRAVTLTLYSVEHGKDYKAEGYPKTFTITQDKMLTNILERDGGSVLTEREFVAYRSSEANKKSSFYMECSAPWRLESKPDWITLSYSNDDNLTEGEGVADGEYYDVNMKVENNTSTAASGRSGRVEFAVDADGSGMYSKKIGFDVKQDAFVWSIEAEKGYNYDAINTKAAAPITIELTNEAEISHNIPTWANFNEVSKKKSEDGKTTIYTYSINPSHNIDKSNLNNPRGGDYTISVKGVASLSRLITISQSAFTWKLSGTELEEFEEIKGSERSIAVQQCSTDGNGKKCYSVDLSNCTWLDKAQSPGSDTWTFTTNAVNTGGSRSGSIEFILNHPSVTDRIILATIEVTQRAYVWEVSDATKTEFDPICESSDDYTGIIKVKSSGKWTASYGADWISGDETGVANRNSGVELEFTVEPNYTEEVRNATITITNSDDNSKKKQISITQNGYVFTVDSEEVAIGADKGAGDSLSVTCSGGDREWKVNKVSDDWLEASSKSGKLVISAEEANTTGKERTATVEIKTTDDSKLTRTITVTQEAAK